MNKIATIETIHSFSAHSNADSLELAKVLGFQVVVKKGQFSHGEKVVFVWPDTICTPADWNHYRESAGKHLNDCFGNSFSWEGEAQSVTDAITQAQLANKGPCFRLRKIEYLLVMRNPEGFWVNFPLTSEIKRRYQIGP